MAQQKFSGLLASAGALATTRATGWQLLAAFLFGTAFSTTIFAAEGLRNAFGTKNVQRAKRLVALVLKRCWKVTITMLVATCVALVQGVNECLDPDECEVPGSSRSRWAGALQILREGLVEARRTATDGFQAIKQEFRLYSAAVGQPGLVTLQYMMNLVAPLRLEEMMADALREGLREMAEDDFIRMRLRKLELRRFSTGGTPPQLLAARAYDLGPTAMGFDFDISWDSQLVAEIDATTTGVGARVPVSARNLRFNGPVRVIVTDLTPDAPGYGAVLLSLPSRPEVAIDCSVAYGEVTRVPWLRGELERYMQQHIASEYLWPRRVVAPAFREGTLNETVLLEAQLEELTRDDPLLRAFAARDPNAPTTALRRAVDEADIPSDAPAFNINLGVLGPELMSAVTDFQEFNWTQQLQAADAAARVQLTSALSDAGEAVNATATPWWAAVGQGLQAVGGGLQVAGSFVANVTSGTGSAISGAGSAIAAATAAAASGTGSALNRSLSGASSALSGGAADASAVVTSATNLISKPAGSALAGATGAVTNATGAAGSWSGAALVNVTEGVTSSLTALEPRLPRPRRKRADATTPVPRPLPRVEPAAAALSKGDSSKGEPGARRRGDATRRGEGSAEGRLAEAEPAEAAVVRARGLVSGRRRLLGERRGERRGNSSLLERVLLSGGSVPPFANGRVVGRVLELQATTAPARNATTTVPAGFTGEPAAQDPDEWW